MSDFLDETLALAQDARRQLHAHKAIDAVRALHTPVQRTVSTKWRYSVRQTLCTECRTAYPCATVLAVDSWLRRWRR